MCVDVNLRVVESEKLRFRDILRLMQFFDSDQFYGSLPLRYIYGTFLNPLLQKGRGVVKERAPNGRRLLVPQTFNTHRFELQSLPGTNELICVISEL